MDKNQAIIDYLNECPIIRDNPLFFNFGAEIADAKQLVIKASDASKDRPFIDGSVLRLYTFQIVDYRSISYNELVKSSGYPAENVEKLVDSQRIIDWITDQNDAMNFPNFGESCVVEEIKATTNVPNISNVDSELTPTIARYSISITVQYLDKSKMIWTD